MLKIDSIDDSCGAIIRYPVDEQMWNETNVW